MSGCCDVSRLCWRICTWSVLPFPWTFDCSKYHHFQDESIQSTQGCVQSTFYPGHIVVGKAVARTLTGHLHWEHRLHPLISQTAASEPGSEQLWKERKIGYYCHLTVWPILSSGIGSSLHVNVAPRKRVVWVHPMVRSCVLCHYIKGSDHFGKWTFLYLSPQVSIIYIFMTRAHLV